MGERFRGDDACRDALRDRGLPRAPGGRDPRGCLQERRLQRSGPRARGAGARSGADRTFSGRDRTSDRRGGRASGPSRRVAGRCGHRGAPARATGGRGPPVAGVRLVRHVRVRRRAGRAIQRARQRVRRTGGPVRLRFPRTTTYDLPLLLVVLALLLMGLAMVYGAGGMSALDANEDPGVFLAQQSAGAVLGIAAMSVAARVDYHRLRVLAVPWLLRAVALLVAVLVPGVGVTAGGATRWLRFGGLVGLQPAELAKLALIVYLATWLGARRDDIGSWRVTVPFVLITMLVLRLVVAEPDLGTAIVIVVVALAIYFSAGPRPGPFLGPRRLPGGPGVSPCA